MSSSGMQLLGFFLTLAGLGATVAATFMVEWKQRLQGSTHYFYEGLWMSCSGNDITTCEIHESLLKLPVEVQATRAVMLLSIFLSTVALMVSTVGMKCTRFMDGRAESKSIAAMIGGIMFMVSGLLTIVITSWYVKMIIQTFHESNHLQRYRSQEKPTLSLVRQCLSAGPVASSLWLVVLSWAVGDARGPSLRSL
ncbi:claudin-19-like isoform X2 [Seriola dumerili]|uniref:claudin-19-like isoform X2 n=1 Tax=Seriola dumerili TaxID=41447 RepID=UPI000BBEE0C8|nr:claudin-19-like isoform X2 [Seriola dumerili]